MGDRIDPVADARRDKTPPINLPVLREALIGREREVAAAVERILVDGVGLLTLTGAGGSGKTRLALQLAADMLQQFADGVFLVPLASIRDPDLVASTIVQALGIHDSGGRRSDEVLRAYLCDRHVLLVLDNFEHLVVAAPVVTGLLAACPRLQVLATSRTLLNVRGEHDFSVPPLRLPSRDALPSVPQARQSPAVQLFIERARAVQADFTLANDNVATIVELCHRLDGLPLAIELAAARLRHLTPAVLLARLERRLPVLTGGARDLPARQQTLRDAIAWSYDLLGERERLLFRRVAVFVGGCTLEGAEALCATHTDDEAEVLDGITSLVDRSLMTYAVLGSSPRFGMLETIREYALEKLVDSGEEDALRRRHAEYFVRVARHADLELRGSGQRAWLARLEADHDNFRAALAWSQADASRAELGMHMAGALGKFWNARGYYVEGSRWLRETLAACESWGPSAERAYALLRAGSLAHWGGDAELAEELLRECLSFYEALGDDAGSARALSTLGLVAVYREDWTRAVALAEESVARARAAGDSYGAGYSLINLARVRFELGDLARARRDTEEGIALCRAASDDWAVAVGLRICQEITVADE